MVEIEEVQEAKVPQEGFEEYMDRYKNKTHDEMFEDINKLPFFMTQLTQDEENDTAIEALKALAYEGTAQEVAQNFREQGNDCYRVKQYKDAIQYYTKALDQQCGVIGIEVACYGNRAQCNLELKNYRRCFNDCVKALELEPNNVKAWYRSAKACHQMGKLDESLTCCEHGLSIDKDNAAIIAVQEAVRKRKEQLAKLEETRQIREAEKAEKTRIFTAALRSRHVTQMFTEADKDRRSNAGDLKAQLENDQDPSSEIFYPILFLYPIARESDIFQQVSEGECIGDLVGKLFEQPPAWVEKFDGHKLGNLDVFAPTSSGGLAKVGLKSTLAKALSTQTPDITMVDGMARFYLVPKSQSKEWLDDWKINKQQLYP